MVVQGEVPVFLFSFLLTRMVGSQLSYHGLAELNTAVPEHGLAVLFRNNHFSVLYKHKGELLLLVTDAALAATPAVWVSVFALPPPWLSTIFYWVITLTRRAHCCFARSLLVM